MKRTITKRKKSVGLQGFHEVWRELAKLQVGKRTTLKQLCTPKFWNSPNHGEKIFNGKPGTAPGTEFQDFSFPQIQLDEKSL